MKQGNRVWQFDYLGLHLARRQYPPLIARELRAQPDARVLDVGCGNTPWRSLFPAPARYMGLDVVAGPGVDVVASAEKMPLPDESFDLIFSNAVLEHIPDVVSAVAEMHRVLRPGGKVILGTHGTWPIHGAPHDYRRWTPYGLKYEFKAFRHVEVEQLGGPLANVLMLANCYVRRAQEASILLRFLLAPWVTFNNLLGSKLPGCVQTPATVPTFYIIVATKA